VAADVVRRLGLRDPVRVVTGFDRPNLSFSVARPAGHEKRRLMGSLLAEPDALPAIVYAGTRAGAEEIAARLCTELGVQALPYHAGLERAKRAEVQRRFLADEVPVIVATNAFGMGIDKPNVRTVLHASVPASLEAYYQEAGRAGRDGQPARAVLLAEGRDKALHVHFIKHDEVSPEVARALAERIAWAADEDGAFALDARKLGKSLGVSDENFRALIGHLARAGAIEVRPSPPDQVRGSTQPWDGKVAALLKSAIADAERARWRQYREVWAYVEEEGCRRRRILRHFGDTSEPSPEVPCCDACDASLRLTAPAPDPVELSGIDDAIIAVAGAASPSVGRNLCAEILHGARTKKIARNSYDGLPAYGLGSDMRRADIVQRIDELVGDGRLRLTRGPYPVLELPAA
jgi:ATP-dependent DNA helicase RecQ